MNADLSATSQGWIPQLSRRTFLLGGGSLLAFNLAGLRAAADLASPYHPPPESPCLAVSRGAYPPLLERFIAKLDPAADGFHCERYAAEIQPSLKNWTGVVLTSPYHTGALESCLSESFQGCSMSSTSITPLRSSGPLHIERRSFEGRAEGRAVFLSSWGDWLSSLASVRTFELQIFGYRLRDEPPLMLETKIAYELVGTTRSGSVEQRTGVWHLCWRADLSTPDVRSKESAADPIRRWAVQTWAAETELRSSRTGPGFNEITACCLDAKTMGAAQLLPGIDHWRSVLDGACGIDVYGNHGVAVGDLDGSGFDSFYVCQPGGLPNRLYRNRGNGTFEDITESSGTGILDGSASALFVDFWNRGRQDLLVVRSGGPLLFENLGEGRFEPRPDAFHFARAPQGTFTGAAAADYNRDGLVDVYLCIYSYYKGLDHHQYPSPYYDAQNGPPNFLFRNKGDGTFEDVTASGGMDQNNDRFSFAASWCDYDQDGWPDLYVANDFGRKNLYRNNRDGTFTDVAGAAGVEDCGPGMSICWLDAENDGKQDLYVANMWLAEGRRLTADDQFLPGVSADVRALYRKHNAGNSMYRNMGNGTFEDRTAAAGTAMGGWSWSCAAWDFDNDGWDDLCVANGFVSAPNRYDLQSFFWRQVAQRSMTSSGPSPDYEPAWNAINELLRSDYSWSGYQRNAFFVNHRDGSFGSAAGALGLDLIDDCRAFSLTDIDHDGRLEVVFKNRTGPQLRIFRNDAERLGNSAVFGLRGHTSNRDGIGASVTIESGGGLRQTKYVVAGSGFASQHTKDLFFGLGPARGPLTISVCWPTGKRERYEGIPINHHVRIEEGVQTLKAIPYASSAFANAEAPVVVAPPVSTVSRSWLLQPLKAPDLYLNDLQGNTHQLSKLQGRPTLLTFVRAACGESLHQLREFARAPGKLPDAGLAQFVVAIGSGDDHAAISGMAGAAQIAIPLCLADERSAGAWNLQYRYLFDRRRDLPLPASFLLDADGACVCVYQGTVTAEQVLSDHRTAPQTAEERLARALPFAGSYFGAPMVHDYLTFGIAFSQAGYAKEAQAAFQHAIDANPGLQVAWFNLGTSFVTDKNYVEARRCLSEAVRLNPQDSDAWNNLGSVSGTEAKYDEALEEFRHAAMADPYHANAVGNMMRIYEYQHRAADAQRALEELVARAPNIAQLHLDLSITLVAQNQWQQAREELQTAIRLQPGNPDALNNLGATLLHLDLLPEALEQFEQCRRVAPDFNRASLNAALVYSRIGEPGKARRVLEEFLARHPDDADVRVALDRISRQ